MIPDNAIRLTEDAADKIADILALWYEHIDTAAVFDSDHELADDGGNVYVIELSDGMYLTATTA